MNIEDVIITTGSVIAKYRRTHNEFCMIGVRNGHIVCRPPEATSPEFQAAYHLTRWQMENGLTPRQWNLLGEKIINLLNKEKECQPPQKH